MSEDIVIDPPDGIEHFRMCALIARLRLETQGLKFKGRSSLSVAKEVYQLTGTKKGVLAKLEDLYEERYGHRYAETYD